MPDVRTAGTHLGKQGLSSERVAQILYEVRKEETRA